MNARVVAHYLIETAHDPFLAAELMAGEQSAGTFIKVPGETPELMKQFGVYVESLTLLDTVQLPSLPGSKYAAGQYYQRARVTLSFPFETIGQSLTTLFTRANVHRLDLEPNSLSTRLGTQQGLILRALLEKTGLRRVIIAGGDTCGHAARQPGIVALRAILPVAPGAPLCRAYSTNPVFDQIEIALKAGQVGNEDYFSRVLHAIA